jgi:hypothetical protein
MSASYVARGPADRFLDLADAGQNVFLTGQAGTGKSHNVREFLRRHPEVPVEVEAHVCTTWAEK